MSFLGCSSQCYEHVTTQPSGTTGIMSLPLERQHQCLIKVWILKPILSDLLPTLTGTTKRSLQVTFPQVTLPATDKIEVRDGNNEDSPLIYKGNILPVQLFTSSPSVRLTLYMCNTTLYHHLQISYQSVIKQKSKVEVLEPPTDKSPTKTVPVSNTAMPEDSVQVDSVLDSTSSTTTVYERTHDPTFVPATQKISSSSAPHPVNCSYMQIPKYLQPQPLPQTNFYTVNSNVTVTCSQPKTNIEGQNKFFCSPEGMWLPSEWPKCVRKLQVQQGNVFSLITICYS